MQQIKLNKRNMAPVNVDEDQECGDMDQLYLELKSKEIRILTTKMFHINIGFR